MIQSEKPKEMVQKTITTAVEATENTTANPSGSSISEKQENPRRDSTSSSDNDEERDLYINSYDIYRTWALNSIDVVKAELLSLCFPLFTHW